MDLNRVPIPSTEMLQYAIGGKEIVVTLFDTLLRIAIVVGGVRVFRSILVFVFFTVLLLGHWMFPEDLCFSHSPIVADCRLFWPGRHFTALSATACALPNSTLVYHLSVLL